MDRYEDTYAPKNPPTSLRRPWIRSTALWGLIGTTVAFVALVGIVWAFWTAAHPRPAAQADRERIAGTSGYYSTEGGHDPTRRPGSTRDELKFRGGLTRPSGAPGR